MHNVLNHFHFHGRGKVAGVFLAQSFNKDVSWEGFVTYCIQAVVIYLCQMVRNPVRTNRNGTAFCQRYNASSQVKDN